MISSKLIVISLLVTFTLAFQSPTPSPVGLPPADLLEDLRKIAEQITGDPENLEKLTQQLKQLSANNKNLAKLIEEQMATAKPVQEADKKAPGPPQPGSNPLVSIQARINAFVESMNQFFTNMRTMFERVPIPDNASINPLKAIQSMESQFQNMFERFRNNNPLAIGLTGQQEVGTNNVQTESNKDKVSTYF
ncbi:uncharacterized protein LOC107361888 [Tetranychus urticae]|uniref:uncharacterized protein LOC107361888 n=1 Tax=Tetranychus urticae TaxID=32264 RepID=UPI00077BB62D|nr:uncharacterized protein LOC107361888 [Tetranychus urticae]